LELLTEVRIEPLLTGPTVIDLTMVALSKEDIANLVGVFNTNAKPETPLSPSDPERVIQVQMKTIGILI